MFAKRYFSSLLTYDDGAPASLMWIGDDCYQGLVEVDTGRLRGFISQDGDGTYMALVYVSLFRMLRLKRANGGWLRSLRPFPRCAVQLWDVRSLDDAVRLVEAGLSLGRRDQTPDK